jgi:hypothetical protein
MHFLRLVLTGVILGIGVPVLVIAFSLASPGARLLMLAVGGLVVVVVVIALGVMLGIRMARSGA